MAGEFQSFLIRPHSKQFDGFIEGLAEVELNVFHLELARFDLGKVEDVVE